MRILISVVILAFCNVIFAQNRELEDIVVYDTFEEMEPIFNYENDTTYLINFWATWCKPCVAELPYIDSLVDIYSEEKFKVILVSLDFEKQIESRLLPFINKHELKSSCVLLADGKPNRWIDKVDPRWSGAIPITVIYNQHERLFYEKEFHSTDELTNIIQPLINKNEK